MKHRIILLAQLLVVLPLMAQSDWETPRTKPFRGSNALAELLRDTRVGEAQTYRSLAVFPLFSEDTGRRGYLTLDAALAKGLVRITEKGEGNVPELFIENRADETVFLMAGEIVTGGKQNRVISQDILLPERSGPVSLGVFCVEHGRWTKQTATFSAEKEIAHNALRQQLNASSVSQGEVWGEVARKNAAVAPGTRAETGYLGDSLKDTGVQRELSDYSRAIKWAGDANGMAVMIGHRIVGVELFGDTGTFRALREKLLRSYAVDALEAERDERPIISDRKAVELVLRRAEEARLTPKETIGIGRLYGVESRYVYGNVLTWHEQRSAHGVVHASLFNDDREVEIQPRSRDMWPRPLPRDE